MRESLGSEAISVIVCVYTEQRWDDIRAGYEALLAQSQVPEIVLVVDYNASLLIRAQTAFPRARVVANSGRRGLSGARNTGVAVARGELLLFLDDDAVPELDWVEQMVQPFADPNVVGVGGWATPAWDGGRRPSWFPEPFLWVVGASYEGLPPSGSAIRNPIGCSMAFRRDAVLRAGGFDEEVGRVGTKPTGCEETELAIRIAAQNVGARLVQVTEARITHRVPRQRQTVTYFMSRCYHEGRSKAAISRTTSRAEALSTEQAYVRRTLPRSVASNCADTFRRRELDGFLRALSVILGLLVTTLGYAVGQANRGTTA